MPQLKMLGFRRDKALAIAAMLCVAAAAGALAGALPWTSPASVTVRTRECVPASADPLCHKAQLQTLADISGQSPGAPVARAIPGMATLDTPIWLKATGLPQGTPVALTLRAPDGTICDISSDQLEAEGLPAEEPNTVQAFVTPSDCANVEGTWTATFTVARVEVSAQFVAVEVPHVSAPTVNK